MNLSGYVVSGTSMLFSTNSPTKNANQNNSFVGKMKLWLCVLVVSVAALAQR